MKKRLLECALHGITLHRCKRIIWHTDKNKFADSFTEECYKCLQEGLIKKKKVEKKKQSKHTKI